MEKKDRYFRITYRAQDIHPEHEYGEVHRALDFTDDGDLIGFEVYGDDEPWWYGKDALEEVFLEEEGTCVEVVTSSGEHSIFLAYLRGYYDAYDGDKMADTDPTTGAICNIMNKFKELYNVR